MHVRTTADALESDEYLQKSTGSGVVIIDRGTILTSLHVVAGAGRIRVMFADGLESDARIVGQHPENDLAVLQADTVPDDLAAAVMRPRADLQPGDTVVAVGFPFGIGPSVSAGVVSGLKREYRSPGGASVLSNLIQFDAAVNPGSSGGPAAQRGGRSGRHRHRHARSGRRRLRRHRLRGAGRDRFRGRRARRRSDMTFLWPEFLWLLLAVPASIAALCCDSEKEEDLGGAVRQPVPDQGGDRPGPLAGDATCRRRCCWWRSAAMIAAIARPAAVITLPTSHETVILAIDVSGSMRASDVEPTRIEAAQAAARAFVAEQPRSTRIGVVAFAGSAALVQPPTSNSPRRAGGDRPAPAAARHRGRQRASGIAEGDLPGQRLRCEERSLN